MGKVTELRSEPERDRYGRIKPVAGQIWVQKVDDTYIWKITAVKTEMVDDEERTFIYLEDALTEDECESCYTEKYFHQHFYEINEPRRKENKKLLKSKGAHLLLWAERGPLLAGGAGKS